MTSLLSDLTAALENHHNRADSATMLVPVGMLRAARTMLERYEGWPLFDRPLHPEFIDHATTPRRGGGKARGHVERARRRGR